MLSRRLEQLSRLKPDYDNLRCIAISNLKHDNERSLKAWWHRKYRIPPKTINEYTFEELLIEHFEDFYYDNPEKVDEFFDTVKNVADDFSVPEQVRHLLGERKGEVDISRYQTPGDEDLSDEDCNRIFESIRGVRQIPVKKDKVEFDDTFVTE